MNKGMYIGAGAAAVIIAAGAAGMVTASQPADNTLTYSGSIKPESSITVNATCGDDSTPAVESSLFGHAELVNGSAEVTLPTNIGPGPDAGYHTMTLHCDTGDLTVRLGDDGNGTAKTIADKNNA